MELHRNLWRHAEYLKLWSATSISHFGTMFGALGLTALLFLDATPAQMGLLAAVSGLPVLLFSLAAGVWVDRLPRRRLMLLSDFGRAALLFSVPLAAVFDVLTMEQLYVVAFGVGFLGLFFDLSYRAILPTIVERHELIDANSKLQMSESVGESVSPAIGGGIVQLFGGPAAVFVHGLTFAASGLFVSTIKTKGEPQPNGETTSILREAIEGMSAVWREPSLRAIAGTDATLSVFGGFFFALYSLWIVIELEFSPVALGVLIGAGGIGSFFGAAFVGRVSRRLGIGPAMIYGRLLAGLVAFLIPLAGGPFVVGFTLLFLNQVLGDGFWVVYDINAISLRQTITPDRILGRVNATLHLLGDGLRPIGAILAGLIATVVGVQAALFVAAFGMTAAALWLVFSPIPRYRGQAPAASRTE